MTEVDVHTPFDAAGKFEFQCPECGSPLEFVYSDDRVTCIDYDDMYTTGSS